MSMVGRPNDVSEHSAGDLDDVSSAGRKRSMSWLLAAVMSVCEEHPRKCRSLRRRRLQRLRGGGGGEGEFDVGNNDLEELSTPLLDDDEVMLPVKRPADDHSHSLETVPLFSDPLTYNCRTENCQ